MINGKLRFPGYYKDIYFHNEADYDYYKKRVLKELQEKAERELHQQELREIREQLKVALEEKRQYDIRMKQYADLKSLEIRKQVDDYNNQITKLTLASQICQKALHATKKEAAEKYRLNNPFSTTLLKKLQNKEYTLSNKLGRYA